MQCQLCQFFQHFQHGECSQSCQTVNSWTSTHWCISVFFLLTVDPEYKVEWVLSSSGSPPVKFAHKAEVCKCYSFGKHINFNVTKLKNKHQSFTSEFVSPLSLWSPKYPRCWYRVIKVPNFVSSICVQDGYHDDISICEKFCFAISKTRTHNDNFKLTSTIQLATWVHTYVRLTNNNSTLNVISKFYAN